MKRYLLNIAALISQSINTVFLFGSPDMTVSARCYLNRDKGIWKYSYWIINGLFFWQEDHCKSSFSRDIEYAKYVMKMKEYNELFL